jgi:hypothetical protein
MTDTITLKYFDPMTDAITLKYFDSMTDAITLNGSVLATLEPEWIR